MKSMIHENQLCPKDEELFASIWKQLPLLSASEKHFFQELYSKMLDQNAPWPETLVWEQDNPDRIYLLRHGYDEFMLGCDTCREEWLKKEIHTMNLYDALYINLKEAGILDRNITLLHWLRECDFKCVRYDHANDGNNI